MSKSKKSRKTEDSSEDSNESSTSEASTSDGSSDEGTHKRSKHRKKSKKVKKHKSNKKKTHNSDSEDDSDSSTAAADAVKVSKKSKKHKKHKKKRSSRHHPHSDDEVRIQEPEKVTYISSGDEAAGKYRQHQKRDKRLDELKRLRDVGGGELEKDVKSKWDSPAEKERRSYNNRAGGRDRDEEARFRDDHYGRGPNEDHDREDRRRPDYRRHDREGPLADEHHRRHVDGGRYHEDGLPQRGPDVISRRHEDGRGRAFEGGRGRGNEPFAPGWRERENLPAPISGRDSFGAPNNSRYGGGRDGDRAESSRNNYRERSHDRDGDRGGAYERKHFAGDSSRGGRVGGRNDGPHFEQRPSADERESGTAQIRNPFARKPNEIPEFATAMEADIGDGRRVWRGGNRRGGGGGGDRRDTSGRSQMPNFGSRDNNGGGYRFNDKTRAGSVDRRDDRGGKESRDRSDSHQRRSEKRSQHSDHHGSIKREPIEEVGNGRGRDRERNRDISRPEHSRSRSPNTKAHRFRKHKDGADEDSKNFDWGTGAGGGEDSKDKAAVVPPVDKEKPNFGLSGKLTEDTNKVNGVVIKYAEPQEARKPKRRWRLYPFKGEQSLQTLYIHRQSCYLIGRERKICDIPVDHPSCSKQHAVLQYRLVPYTKDDGTKSKRVRPYVLDMESANGTFVNNKKIEPKKYMELIEKDVIKFGFSSREYVLLHENSKDDEEDDDIDLEMETAIIEEPTPAVAGD